MIRQLARHLTYANVVATLTAFVVFAGGAAIAANQLAKNSVGKRQLKANSVTTAKIKKGAVTRAKIRDGAIDGSKLGAGAIGATKLSLAGLAYTRVVERLSTPINISAMAKAEPAIHNVPISYTQPPERIDTFVGALDVTFDAACGAKGGAIVLVLADPVDTGGKPGPELISSAVAVGVAEAKGAGTTRVDLGPFLGGTRVTAGAPQPHSFAVLVQAACEAGSVTATSLALDVIGTPSP